ncbi:hypothetical protein [Nostoc sp. ChiQUE01b]|uniref:hypothetical protein n=1 Tax=Nostoc sp. ChiQUE01b TaxID=3075376 RepID=UPI002AD3CB0F|nr:hypothetical protein [Nostoc sp. ChiQUE01b]MDZ8264504.1 hypothetical protein [Nostoc sp. ChiQUE01b]
MSDRIALRLRSLNKFIETEFSNQESGYNSFTPTGKAHFSPTLKKAYLVVNFPSCGSEFSLFNSGS